jgi:transposase-like protein
MTATENNRHRSGRYPRELKEAAVKRVVEGREPVAKVARDLRIKPASLYFAIRKFEALATLDQSLPATSVRPL